VTRPDLLAPSANVSRRRQRWFDTASRWSATDGGVAVASGAISALAGVFAILATDDGSLNPTELVHLSAAEPLAGIARSADPNFHFVTVPQHYDGVYYYAIARDPFLHGTAHTLIDQSGYRYGHPLHGWLAGLLSFGQARWVPLALMLLSLIGLAVAGWATSRLAVRFGRTPWAGLVIAFSPGLLFATTVSTTETVGAALIALTFLAWLNERFVVATVLLIAVCLDKEPYLMVPFGLAVWELVETRRRRSRPDQYEWKAVAIVAGPIATGLWYVYVHAELHKWPWSYDSGNLGKPFAGWVETFKLAHALPVGGLYAAEIGDVTPPVLVVTGLLIVIATILALRLQTIFAAPLIGLAFVTSLQTWRTLLLPHELFRTPAIAVLMAIAVLFARPPTAIGQAARPQT
jgi:hypothetical protein